MLKILVLIIFISFAQHCSSQEEPIDNLLDAIDNFCKFSTKLVTVPFFTQIIDLQAKNIENMAKTQIPLLISHNEKANMATKALRVLLDPTSGNDICIRFNKMMILKKMSGKKTTKYVKKN